MRASRPRANRELLRNSSPTNCRTTPTLSGISTGSYLSRRTTVYGAEVSRTGPRPIGTVHRPGVPTPVTRRSLCYAKAASRTGRSDGRRHPRPTRLAGVCRRRPPELHDRRRHGPRWPADQGVGQGLPVPGVRAHLPGVVRSARFNVTPRNVEAGDSVTVRGTKCPTGKPSATLDGQRLNLAVNRSANGKGFTASSRMVPRPVDSPVYSGISNDTLTWL